MTDKYDQIKGMLYGGAFGDSWGYPTEFKNFKTLMKLMETYHRYPVPRELMITDDTQMHLRTMEAVTENRDAIHETTVEEILHDGYSQGIIRSYFTDTFIRFFYDPKNTRAPGTTCMTALDAKASGVSFWEEIAANNSLGCGTVMRAPWLGALDMSREKIAALSSLQAQVTHGDPKGWVISAVSADLVHRILTGEVAHPGNEDTPEWLFWYALESVQFLSSLKSVLFPEASLRSVWADLIGFAKNGAALRVKSTGISTDICSIFGQGWIADEAFYGALGVVSAYRPDDVREGIHRLVVTNGDSDSLASIGGILFGALYGYDALDYDVEGNLESFYRPQVRDLLEELSRER
jgi:ADP-ribosylglycohydrolase